MDREARETGLSREAVPAGTRCRPWLRILAAAAAAAPAAGTPVHPELAAGGPRPPGELAAVFLFCACMCVFSPVHHLLLVFPTEQPPFRSPAP